MHQVLCILYVITLHIIQQLLFPIFGPSCGKRLHTSDGRTLRTGPHFLIQYSVPQTTNWVHCAYIPI